MGRLRFPRWGIVRLFVHPGAGQLVPRVFPGESYPLVWDGVRRRFSWGYGDGGLCAVQGGGVVVCATVGVVTPPDAGVHAYPQRLSRRDRSDEANRIHPAA